MDDLPKGLSGAEIVDQFTKDVSKTITDKFAKEKDAVRDTAARWAAGTILAAGIVCGGMLWLFNPPGVTPKEWVVHHADGVEETCDLTLAPGDETKAIFTCRFTVQPIHSVPSSMRVR